MPRHPDRFQSAEKVLGTEYRPTQCSEDSRIGSGLLPPPSASLHDWRSGPLEGCHGGAGTRCLVDDHDLGEGASGGSLTFSTTQWGRCPEGAEGVSWHHRSCMQVRPREPAGAPESPPLRQGPPASSQAPRVPPPMRRGDRRRVHYRLTNRGLRLRGGKKTPRVTRIQLSSRTHVFAYPLILRVPSTEYRIPNTGRGADRGPPTWTTRDRRWAPSSDPNLSSTPRRR